MVGVTMRMQHGPRVFPIQDNNWSFNPPQRGKLTLFLSFQRVRHGARVTVWEDDRVVG